MFKIVWCPSWPGRRGKTGKQGFGGGKVGRQSGFFYPGQSPPQAHSLPGECLDVAVANPKSNFYGGGVGGGVVGWAGRGCQGRGELCGVGLRGARDRPSSP